MCNNALFVFVCLFALAIMMTSRQGEGHCDTIHVQTPHLRNIVIVFLGAGWFSCKYVEKLTGENKLA